MNRHGLIHGALVLGLVFAAAGCEDGLTEANENPNAPTDVGAQFLLPQAMRASVEAAFGGGQMLSHTAIWPQHAVQIQYPDEEVGQVRPDRMQGYWNAAYAGPLKDVQTVIDKGRENQRPNVEAVGLIWKQWIFHLLTDYWGDVPYSEALQGEEGMTEPAYDPQSEIYAGMITALSQASGMLNASGSGFGSGDLLYADDVELWRRFANSLRMRLAMRMSEVDPGGAQAAFVAAYDAGGFQSNADNAMFEWASAPYENPLYENWTGRDDHGISATMVDTLKSLADPRLELYAEPAAQDGEYRGHANGWDDLPEGQSLSWFSRIGNFWRANGSGTPTALMTYSEVLFLQAEAAARDWIAEDPAELYEAAIRANMTQYDAWSPANAPTDAEIDAYLAQDRVQYGGIDDIHLQKWISLYMNGPEAWADSRRTDVPDLAMGPHLLLSRIPVRFTYPAGEQSLNKTNLDAAIARQGANTLVTTVWWDVN